MFKYYFFIVSILIAFYSCKNDSTTLFTDLDKSSTGIDFQNTIFEEEKLNVVYYTYFYNGGGVAVANDPDVVRAALWPCQPVVVARIEW